MSFNADLQPKPGDPVPPLINGFRPDVISRSNLENSIVIAEAKTDRDLDNKHTENQIASFINYLEKKGNGCLVLSVTGCGADRAKTFLRFMHQSEKVRITNLTVFDGCDFWQLESFGGIAWHLG
ncbi:MAG: hypothetical protein OXG56_01035 [Gammaproteobacteria bacterium]|nr:hypothetical protein [Gammaproteobacteria bacterium]